MLEDHSMDTIEIPLPPEEFMRLVCGDANLFPTLKTHFLEIGKSLLGQLKAYGLIRPGFSFLDVGCGCGRVARVLFTEPLEAYVGFDRHIGMVQWCQREITSRDARFQFHWFDIKSSYEAWDLDGNRGSVDATQFRFPFSPKTFDTCLLTSVFTHMPFDEVVHYLQELSLVTKPGGRVFCSVFFARDKPYHSGINYYHDRVAFIDAAKQNGFRWELKSSDSTDLEYYWYLLTKPS